MEVTRRLALGAFASLPMGGLAWAQPGGVHQAVYQTRGLERPIIVIEPVTDTGPMSGATLLLLHGAGGLVADLPVFVEHGRRLAELGYRIVMPDYFSDARDAAQSDELGWWPRAVVDATDWTLALPGVHASCLGAMGYSRGGYLAAEVAVQQTPIRAVVGVASAGNVRQREIVRRPSVMLIHAAGDPVIPPRRTKRWARILGEQGVQVEIVVLNVRRHHFRPGEWTDIFERADGFFRRTLIPEV